MRPIGKMLLISGVVLALALTMYLVMFGDYTVTTESNSTTMIIGANRIPSSMTIAPWGMMTVGAVLLWASDRKKRNR